MSVVVFEYSENIPAQSIAITCDKSTSHIAQRINCHIWRTNLPLNITFPCGVAFIEWTGQSLLSAQLPSVRPVYWNRLVRVIAARPHNTHSSVFISYFARRKSCKIRNESGELCLCAICPALYFAHLGALCVSELFDDNNCRLYGG